MEIVIALITLAVGLIIGWFFGNLNNKGRISPEEVDRQLEAQRSNLEKLRDEQAQNFEKRLSEREKSFEDLISEKEKSFERILNEKENSFSESISKQAENFNRERENLEKKNRDTLEALEKKYIELIATLKEQFRETSGRMSQELKATTEEMLKQRQEEFATSSGEKLNSLLQPLENSLKAMQEKVAENTSQHSALGGKLTESIKNLLDHTEAAQASADKLSSMLKGNNRYQGTWGELILQEILESLNFKEGIHFDTQQTLKDDKGNAIFTEEGKRLRPDIVLHIDRDKDVIIDAKASLSAFFQYQESDNDYERETALKNHITSLEKHVDELSKKDYSKYVNPGRIKMGYVIMFVPNTSALHLATSKKPTLWREAMEKNVYIADEQTLFAALKIVSLTWQQIAQADNHKKVYALAEEMLKRVGAFMKYYTEIGNSLEKASKNYSEGLKKLEDRGQSIPKTCRSLIELGAKAPQVPKGVDKELLGISPDFNMEKEDSYEITE